MPRYPSLTLLQTDGHIQQVMGITEAELAPAHSILESPSLSTGRGLGRFLATSYYGNVPAFSAPLVLVLRPRLENH